MALLNLKIAKMGAPTCLRHKLCCPTAEGQAEEHSARRVKAALSMRSCASLRCVLFVEAGVKGAPRPDFSVHKRWQGGASAPVSLFGGLFGGRRKSQVREPREKEFKYHDVPPPFPPSLLSNTFLNEKELRCCYKATVDGFGAMTFHERCDFKGPCVIVATSSKGMRVGAFNPEGYRSTDDYYDSFDAFLFYWPSSSPPRSSGVLTREEASTAAPIILPKVGGSGAALFDYARGGPQFGADGLLIGRPQSPVMGGFAGPETDSGQGQGQLSDASSRLGLSYAKRPDGKESLFGEDSKASLVEIEVFCSPAIAALY